MKFSTNQKKLVYRIAFYSFFFLLLISIPTIYKRYFMDCGIDMLLFYFSPYIICELIAIISVVFLAECWLFAKLGIKIKNEELRFKVIGWLIFLLFFGNKMLLNLFGVI